MERNTYAVYVADANGWDENCPDSESVFFGSVAVGKYYDYACDLPADIDHHVDLGSDGFVVVETLEQAVALRDKLNTTGDWMVPPEINPTGEETRPIYAIRELTQLFEIQTRNEHPGATGYVPWASDTIGENEPRSEEACMEDIRMFQAGDCGAEDAEFFANPDNWRVAPVPEVK